MIENHLERIVSIIRVDKRKGVCISDVQKVLEGSGELMNVKAVGDGMEYDLQTGVLMNRKKMFMNRKKENEKWKNEEQ